MPGRPLPEPHGLAEEPHRGPAPAEEQRTGRAEEWQAGPGPAGGGRLLPAWWRRHLWAVVASSAVWVLAWAVAVYDGRRPLAIERPLNHLLTANRPRFGHVASAFASINRPVLFAALLVVMLGLCAAGRSLRAAATLAVALTVTLVVVETLKVVVRRVNLVGTLTFPSGHVAATSVLATVAILLARSGGPLGRRLPSAARTAIVVIAVGSVVAVAASMIVLGNHFVTDTIAAAPIALSVTLVVAAAADSLSRPRSQRRQAGRRPAGPGR